MFCIAVGFRMGNVDSNQLIRVKFKQKITELPELIFLFWEQFLPGEFLDAARNSFMETGLPGELFDETLQLLVEDGLIVQTGNVSEGLARLIPAKYVNPTSCSGDMEMGILQLANGALCLNEIMGALRSDNIETFYNAALRLAKEQKIYFLGSR